MKERYVIGSTLLSAVIGFGLIFLFTQGTLMPKNQAMPWDSYLNENRQTVVFDLTMGQSTLIDAARLFGTEIEASLFENEAADSALEVYFSNTKVGGISAKIILNLVAEPETIKQLRSHIDQIMLMPSGVKKTTFTRLGERLLSHLTIKSLSFIPRADLAGKVITTRFGIPSQVDNNPVDGNAYWHYPNKGLRVIIRDKQKEIFEFYNP